MYIIPISLILGLTATPALAADQFDLNCTGKSRPRPHAGWKPLEIRFRLDLAAQAWCRDECREVLKIDEISAGKITLRKSDPADRSLYSYQEIDRVSGTFKMYMSGGGSYWEEEATCTRAPFSGFPTTKF